MWYDPKTLLANLPLDLILEIVPHLTPRDIISLRLVDRAHNKLFSSEAVCHAGVKLFFRDAWERCIGNNNRAAPGKETFDRVYLRRQRFRESRPTRFSTIPAGRGRRSAKLSHHDGILSIMLHGGPPELQVFDLYFPKYSDNGTLIPNMQVPLVGTGYGSNDGGSDLGDSRPLLDMNSPLVEWIARPGQSQTRRGRMQRAIPSGRSNTPNPAMAFDFNQASPLLACNEGILLVAAPFQEERWKVTSASPRFPSQALPTAFATFSVKRDESFGMALQTWVSHDTFEDQGWDYYDCPIASVSRHYAVWRVLDWRGYQPHQAEASVEMVKVLPIHAGRESVGKKLISPRRLSDVEYQTHVTHFAVNIPYSEVPPVDKCRAIGVDKDGKLIFYAAGGRGIGGVVLFVFGIQWEAHGNDSTELRTITAVTMVAKVKLSEVGILREMVHLHDRYHADLALHKQSLHFEDSLVSHREVNKIVDSGDHISLVLRAQLHDLPRGSPYKTESCFVWRIPITQTKCGLDPDWTTLSTDQSALQVNQGWKYPSSLQPPIFFLALNPAGNIDYFNYVPFKPSSSHAVPYDIESMPRLPAYRDHQLEYPLPLPSVTDIGVGGAHTGGFILPYILPRYPGSSYLPPKNHHLSEWVDRIRIPVFNGIDAEYEKEEGVDVVENKWFVELELGRDYTTRAHLLDPDVNASLLGEGEDMEKKFSVPLFKMVSVLGVGDGWVMWKYQGDNENEYCIMRFD